MATTETLTTGPIVGTSVPRKEDRKLVTGNGQFIDNINLPGQVWLASSAARMRTRGSARSTSPRRASSRASARVQRRRARRRLGRLAAVRVARHRGHQDALALPARVRQGAPRRRRRRRRVAETRALAKDAAELVEVEYEPLGAVTDVAKALDDGAPLVHDDLGTNECYVWKLDAGEVDQAFMDADVTARRYRQQRLIPAAMEPRGALAQELPGTAS